MHDLERSRRFYLDRLDFAEVAASGSDLERAGRQRSAVFEAGAVRIVCSEPLGEGGRAWRYLRKHPDGVGAVVFEVEDAERCFRLLEERGGTPITDVQEHRDPRRHAADLQHHDAARRHDLPLRRAAAGRRRSTPG